MPIDFFDTLRSVRADGKLLGADAISGAFVKSVAISGETLEVTVQKTDGTEEVARFVGPKQPSAFLRRATWQSSINFNAASFLAGHALSTRTNSFTIPRVNVQSHFAFWQEAVGTELTGIVSGRNLWSAFSAAPPTLLTIDNVAGYFWRTSFKRTNSAEAVYEMLFASELPVFTRYSAFRVVSDGLVFVAADFIDADRGRSSLTSTVQRFAVPVSISENVYWGIAVPDAQPEVLDIVSAGAFSLSEFGNWVKQPATVQLNGEAYAVWHSTVANYPLRNSRNIRIAQQESERLNN